MPQPLVVSIRVILLCFFNQIFTSDVQYVKYSTQYCLDMPAYVWRDCFCAETKSRPSYNSTQIPNVARFLSLRSNKLGGYEQAYLNITVPETEVTTG